MRLGIVAPLVAAGSHAPAVADHSDGLALVILFAPRFGSIRREGWFSTSDVAPSWFPNDEWSGPRGLRMQPPI